MPPDGTNSVLIRHWDDGLLTAEQQVGSALLGEGLVPGSLALPHGVLSLPGRSSGDAVQAEMEWRGLEVSRACDFPFMRGFSFQAFSNGSRFKLQQEENRNNSFCIPDLFSGPIPGMFSNHELWGGE